MISVKHYLLMLFPLTFFGYTTVLGLLNIIILPLYASISLLSISIFLSILSIIHISEQEETKLVSDHLNIEE